ncbi:MAG: response regulator [Thermodesulfovibrionales bacterium]|nr:response regulator [Thermodesulfovibrionales bacterium]
MKKILIVDDKDEVRELVDVTLQVEDYQILQCNNGDDAIRIARDEQPDLIIMDVMMPGEKDGFEATSIIKGATKTKHCKVIMLTGKGQDIDKEKGYSVGADEYFVKPFSPLDLIRKVEEILG